MASQLVWGVRGSDVAVLDGATDCELDGSGGILGNSAVAVSVEKILFRSGSLVSENVCFLPSCEI